jgi:hypothetical protein
MTIEGEHALEAEHRQPQRLRRTGRRQRTFRPFRPKSRRGPTPNLNLNLKGN